MVTVSEGVKYIGVDDDNIDLFEGQYPVPLGISYNSYLIEGDEPAILDAVDVRRCEEWLVNLDNALDGRSPSYLIVQHVEPDHSGSIRKLLNRYPGLRIVATAKAIAMLDNFFEDAGIPARSMDVADGGTLRVGDTTLSFVTAPMVHWPEVMMTLDETRGVLFSADAFGSFAMAQATDAWDSEARRYYCNIVGKYGRSVQQVMAKLKGRKFSVIAPLHGPVLSDNLAHYWELYDKWSRYEPEAKGVLVAYGSIYGGTAAAARRLADMLRQTEGSGEIELMDLGRHHVSYAVAEAFRLSSMALCSVTCDGAVFPAMHEFISHIESKNLSDRLVGIVENGSWAPTAGRQMAAMLDKMRDMKVIQPMVTIHSRLHDSDIPQLRRLADTLVAGE